MNKQYQLDQWDFEIIYLLKTSAFNQQNHINQIYEIWARRVNISNVNIWVYNKYIASHLFKIIDNYNLVDKFWLFESICPENLWRRFLKINNNEDYWENLISACCSVLCNAKVADLPGYKEFYKKNESMIAK